MDWQDTSTAECLRLLLENQARALRMAALRIESLCTSGTHATQPVHWTGPARWAHDALAQRVIFSLTTAWHAVSNAADESARAVATLASSVG